MQSPVSTWKLILEGITFRKSGQLCEIGKIKTNTKYNWFTVSYVYRNRYMKLFRPVSLYDSIVIGTNGWSHMRAEVWNYEQCVVLASDDTYHVQFKLSFSCLIIPLCHWHRCHTAKPVWRVSVRLLLEIVLTGLVNKSHLSWECVTSTVLVQVFRTSIRVLSPPISCLHGCASVR